MKPASIMFQVIAVASWMLVWSTGVHAQSDRHCEAAMRRLGMVSANDASHRRLADAMEAELERLPYPDVVSAYCRAVADNLKSKLESAQEIVNFTEEEVLRTTLAYERFKIETFVTSGVAPKRYFGFLDGEGKTARYERMLREGATRLAPLLNEYASSRKLEIRVTAKELILTHLSEGGALLLTDEFESVDRVHPVRHVGLDDYRIGFARYPDLLQRVDEAFDTKLRFLSVGMGGRSALIRPMTFLESVLATGVMYLYEKELADIKRKREGSPSLMTLSLDQQFVHTSLVYNSGILFSDERVAQIIEFQTGAYLVGVSEANQASRPRLPVEGPEGSLARLKRGDAVPLQLTSWSAVYHILQRYGAWVALSRFSDLFDHSGALRE